MMELESITVAVTGADGFIGREVIKRLLKSRVKVRILTRNKKVSDDFIDYFQADLEHLSESEALRFLDKVDYVIHCAASMDTSKNLKAINVEATKELFFAADQKKIKKFIFLSSVGVYGLKLAGTITEDQKFNPSGVYEESKALAEKILLNKSLVSNLKRIIVRPSIVYGDNMPNQSLREMIKAIERGYFFYIGKLGAQANYTHVENVADVILLLLFAKQNRYSEYHISENVTMEKFVEIVNSSLGKRMYYARFPLGLVTYFAIILNFFRVRALTPKRIDNLTSRATYTTKRLKKEYNYQPNIKIHEALRTYVQKDCGVESDHRR